MAESNGDYDVAAFSPASSVASSASAMSLSADASPVPSPADSTASTESSSSTTTSESGSCTASQPQSEMIGGGGGKRKQAWEGGGNVALDNDKRRRLQAAASSSSPMPRPTHKPEYNEQLQGQVKNTLGGFHHTCLLAHCQEFFGPGVFWPIFGGQKTPDKLHVMKPQKMSGVFWPRSLLAQKSFGPVYIVQHDSQLEHATRHVALGR